MAPERDSADFGTHEPPHASSAPCSVTHGCTKDYAVSVSSGLMHTVQSGGPTGDPEQASKPPSRETARWAAILCFIAAFMCLVGTGWSVYARWATDDSLGRLGEHLPPDATSALGAMDTLNMVVAVLNAILAVALVAGGIMLLRRKPAGRTVVAVAGVFLLLAPVVTYVLSTQIWSRLVAAMSHVSDMEVMRFGPGVGTMIRGVLVALMMLGLVLAPSTKRWLTHQGQSGEQGPPATMPGPVLDSSLPPPTRGTTLGAAVLSLLGGAVFLFLAVAGVVEALDSDKRESTRVVAEVGAAITTPLAAGLIVGAILLFRRRLSGRTIVIVTWAVVILLATGLLSAVTALDHPRPGDQARIAVLVLMAGFAVAAIALALARSTRRWCQARTGFGGQMPPGLEHPTPTGGANPLAPTQYQLQPIEPPLGADAPEQARQPPPADAARRTRVWPIAAAAGTVVILAAAGAALAFTLASQKSAPTSGAHDSATEATKHPSYGEQISLPFVGIRVAGYVAVGADGTVYVTDYPHSDDSDEKGSPRVLSLPAGSTTPTELPFTGLNSDFGVAVDVHGTVYVADFNQHTQVGRVLSLPAGSTTPTELPFTGLVKPVGVAVDGDGTVYVSDGETDKVLSLRTGSATQTELPFGRLRAPGGVAVDQAGTVYVTDDYEGWVLALPAGSTTPTKLPFTALSSPGGLAVDANGTVYVTEVYDGRVVSLAAGATSQAVLPFTELSSPRGVAVDSAGSVYVTDAHSNVSKLPFT